MSEVLLLRRSIGQSVEALRECYLRIRREKPIEINGQEALDLTVRIWSWYCSHFYDDFSKAPLELAEEAHVFATELTEDVLTGRLDDAQKLGAELAQLLGA